MLNRAASPWLKNEPGGLWDRAWRVERYPAARLGGLFACLVFIIAVIGWRLSQVQLTLPEVYVQEFDSIHERDEFIPTRNGRILTTDGKILAQDVEVFGITAHYRWLEEPPQPDWIKQQLRNLLSRDERKDPERVEEATQELLARRDELWNSLAALTGTPREELNKRRESIQRQVERIRTNVLKRRAERDGDGLVEVAEEETAGDVPAEPATTAPLTISQPKQFVERVWKVLTTPPRRKDGDRFVIQEELAYHPLLEDVTLEMAAEIEAHPDRFPGLRISFATRRVYPYGDFAAHLVGNRKPLNIDEVTARQAEFPNGDPLDYQLGDWSGRTGVELQYEQQLRGLRGVQRLRLNRQGEILETEVIRAPKLGRDVVLTLNVPLQTEAETLLDNLLTAPGPTAFQAEPDKPTELVPEGGCIAVLDVRTGELVVAAVAPRFDLNSLISPDPETWKALIEDRRRPFFSRLTQMTLPPGSVFKAVTSVALLEQPRFNPDATLFCQGYLDHPRSHRCYTFRHYGTGHADVDLTRAIAESCNVYFFTGAREMGPNPLVRWAREFGFGQPTGIDIPGERGGNLPVPPVPGQPGTKPWYPGETLGLSIGQSSLTATPLQIVRMMAAIANGGRLLTPHVVRDIGPAADPEEVSWNESALLFPDPEPIPELSDGTLERVREGLIQVVQHPRGTGYKTVRLKEVRIAGKTGTAEVAGRADHAWFAGFVPADEPRYAFVVVLEHAGSGGRAAGPVAKQIVQAMLKQGLLEVTPSRTPPRTARLDH